MFHLHIHIPDWDVLLFLLNRICPNSYNYICSQSLTQQKNQKSEFYKILTKTNAIPYET